MADSYAVNPQELQQLSQSWNAQAQRVGKLPAQLSTIESRLGTLLENTVATDVLNPVPGGAQLAVWVDLRSKLHDAAGKLNTLVQQLSQDSATLRQSASEYAGAETTVLAGISAAAAGLATAMPGSGHASGTLASLSASGAGPKAGDSTTAAGGRIADTAVGNWQTTGNWTAGINGPRTSKGMETTLPNYSSLPAARRQILANMAARVRHDIGYSQTAYTDGYRDDCSGSVSAAWGLPKPGTNCIGLMGSSISHRVTKDELQPGDALICNSHVALFGGWANSEHSQYYALEDNGVEGTVAHVIPYPYFSHNGKTDGGTYEPYARNGVS
jgi:hypothetical protein